MIYQIDVPRDALPVSFEVMGMRSARKGTHTIEATLVDERGRTQAKMAQDLATGGLLLFDTARFQPGTYTLNADILTADGVRCSQSKSRLECLQGPLFDR